METPENFDFPFPPYDIQLEFMKKLYYTLDSSKLGIFESPTGTGKSLSITCGAIKWLKDRQQFDKNNLTEQISNLIKEKQKIDDSTDWISTQSKNIEINSKLHSLKLEESKIFDYEVKIQNIRKLKETKLKAKLKFASKSKVVEKEVDENAFELEDELLPDHSNNNDTDDISDDKDVLKFEPIKIYICSRTHSQLGQFLGEIRRSPFGGDIRVASLASRQTYCINPNVSSLKNMTLINERCLDLQKKSPKQKVDADGKVTKRAKGSCSCPFYKQSAIEELTSHALTEIQDIEELVQSGKLLNACPYYASRKTAEDAEVILVPYNTILHKPTREANGIKLKNNVVIIDEAHNLLEALAQMYNTELKYSHVYHALEQLKAYKERFKLRFSSDNLLVINQIIFVLNRLQKTLEKCCITSAGTSISTIQNFVLDVGIDQYNMFKLTKFCKDSRLAQKIRGFALKYPIEPSTPKQKSGLQGVRAFLGSLQSKPNTKTTPTKTTPTNSEAPQTVPTPPPKADTNIPPSVNNPLLAVISFLESLTSYDDGRILITKSTNQIECKFQFLLLRSSSHFKDIVQQARAVIVAGGTMSPMTEFRDRLFINAGATEDRIVEFSCGHIVPPENILPIVLSKGVNNETLVFNYEKRMSMIASVKNILVDACKNISGGIVVFFPSYEYENFVWLKVKEVNFDREVFREPKTSSQVDSVLECYARTIKRAGSKGALLFSVVGGKLSEGLNFSDDLGRCVIVVGMPYSNITAADLNEKMSYLDKTEGPGAGKMFYENQCMKAVNQCIGRAVRHKNDYATVLLVDQRYSRKSTMNALPNWIKKSLKICTHAEAMGCILTFFEGKQKAIKI